MKKYLLVSLTILFAAAFVWADETTPATPSVDVEADATLSWGVDLGTGDIKADKVTHGFKNAASFTVKFPLIKKGDKMSTKSDMPVYGQVNLKDIELDILSTAGNNPFRLAGQVGKLEAKLFFYGAYLTVYNKPNFKSNKAQIWEPLEKDKDYDGDAYTYEPGFDGAGTKLGYTNKNFMDLDVGLKLGSNGPWNPGKYPEKDSRSGYWKYFDGETAVGKDEYVSGYEEGQYPPKGNYFVLKYAKLDSKLAGKDRPSSKYGIGVDFSIKPLDKMLELALTANATLSEKYKDAGLNFGVEVKSEPIDNLKLNFGFDGGKRSKDDSKFVWDTLASAEYKLVSGGVYVASPEAINTEFEKQDEETGAYSADPYILGGYSGQDAKPITDLAFFLQVATKADTKEASNLVEGLDAGAYVGIYNVLTFVNKGDKDPVFKNKDMHFPLLLKLWGSYKLSLNDASWIKPFASVWVETNHRLFTKRKIASTPKEQYRLDSHEPSVGVAYNLGVTYSPVEKVEVTAKWEHGKVQKNYYRSAVSASAFGKGAHNGQFVLSLKVKY